jgi:hypothetical protein
MTEIDGGNAYLTTGSVSGNTITGGTTVKINTTTKIDYTLQNDMSVLPSAISGGNRGNREPFSRIIDLKKIREELTITGTLAEETDERAITKRDNLIQMMRNEGALTLVWGQTPHQTLIKVDTDNDLFGVFISRLGFSETSGFVGNEHTSDVSGGTAKGERSTDVVIHLIRGRDMVGSA